MLRSKQTNCINEPFYLGLEGLVCFVLSAPDITCHFQTELCNKDYPHLISDCGEF